MEIDLNAALAGDDIGVHDVRSESIGEQPVVVCLHSSASSSRQWRAFRELLAKSIPGARLACLEGLGHMGPVQAPQSVSEALSVFIGKRKLDTNA